MKKILSAVLLVLATATTLHAFGSKTYNGSGEVLNVDPATGRITIRHKAIKDFSADADTEFTLADKSVAEKIAGHDLVDFVITEDKGNAQITKLVKTGEAEIASNKLQVGQAVQSVLVATGEVAKGVTSPIAPIHEVVSGATDGTTNATGAVLENVESPDVKKSF
jgi:Cu/Ag efflux protein CusF